MPLDGHGTQDYWFDSQPVHWGTVYGHGLWPWTKWGWIVNGSSRDTVMELDGL